MLYKISDKLLYKDYQNFDNYLEHNIKRLKGDVMDIAMSYSRGVIALQFFILFIK